MDSAGNTYQVAAPTARGSTISQAIYYARDIAGAAAGTNTVTVRFDKAVAYADIRILEYSGLDQANVRREQLGRRDGVAGLQRCGHHQLSA